MLQMKNTATKIGTAFERFIRRLNSAKERINDFGNFQLKYSETESEKLKKK